MPELIPVDHDPFAPPTLIPVDHDPFAGDQVQVAPQEWRLPDLAALTGMPSALEQSAAATAANPWQPGMTAGQVLAGRPDDPLAGSFQPGVGVGAIKAFHGSPYDFERFDMSKIGTGEGAQAYGHGLYFAEHEPIAVGYRDRLSTPPEPLRMEYKGENVYDPLSRTNLPDDIYNGSMEIHARSSWTRPEAMTPEYWDRMKGELETTIGNYERAHEKGQTLLGDSLASEQRNLGFARAALNALNDPDFKIIPAKPSSGKVYETSINADPEHFLDWDKPATEQSEPVKQALNQLWEAKGGSLEGRQYPPFAAHGEATGNSLHAALATTYGGPEQATMALREAGIPGIRYLDQGSRGAGEGTHNYVVFDDKLIDIIKKYGLAGLVAGGAATIGGSTAGATHLIPVEHDPFAEAAQ
jgi:hypothetical protein